MEKQKIGENAGKIWHFLNAHSDEILIAKLAIELNMGVEDTALAAGWLARENKIDINRRNGLIFICRN